MSSFKPIEPADKQVFNRFLAQDPPVISEMTFTNLYMWRGRNNPCWRVAEDCLLVILQPDDGRAFGFPPVGTGDKKEALSQLLRDLDGVCGDPRICRADARFVETLTDRDKFKVDLDRDNSDYVYLTSDLINLPGNKYHKKKNHINKFLKNYQFQYKRLDVETVGCFLDLQESWCQLKECTLNPGLFDENIAIYEAITSFEELEYTGGAILIDEKVEAFALGEKLNPDTIVIHIEKANPEIPGLYAAINQLFCRDAGAAFKYVNREQDLGIDGLRKAKLSYHPHHMVDKFTLTLA